jgi:hypothetical protein
MEQTTKRTLALILIGIYLLAACAPAPAATQDPVLIQRLSEQSSLLTRVAQTAQVQDLLLTEQSTALSAAMATPLPSQAMVSETEAPPADTDSTSSESGNVEIPAGPGGETQESGNIEIPSGPDIATQAPEGDESQDEGDVEVDENFDIYCRPLLEMQLNEGDIETINKYESQMAEGKKATIEFPYKVTIKNPVNLRTRPSLLNRIILVLKPGTEVDIIDGPKITLYQNGTQYVWWKVQFGEFIGWAAEMSVCRQFYFMVPATSTDN